MVNLKWGSDPGARVWAARPAVDRILTCHGPNGLALSRRLLFFLSREVLWFLLHFAELVDQLLHLLCNLFLLRTFYFLLLLHK